VLERNAFDLDRILDIEPEFLDRRRSWHDTITTMIITTTTITRTITITAMAA
jgi:hypothetical protein